MRTSTRLFCAAILAIGSGIALADTPGEQAQAQWHQAIQDGYTTLATKARTLASSAGHYCEKPTEDGRKTVESAWLGAFLAWQQVRFVDFGPVEKNNRAWQFQFWPDPKNLVARKARYLTGTEQPVSDDTIDESGVAVQGFPMVEYLLFDQQLQDHDQALPATKSCEILTAVTRHIADNSAQLSADWSDFKEHYLANEAYREATIKAGMTALEILEERRLAQPMGLRGNSKRNPYIADAWRSGHTLAAAEATLAGLHRHYLPGIESLLKTRGQTDLAERIDQQFNKALNRFPDDKAPMAALLGNDEQFRTLQGLYVHIAQLATLVNDQAAVSLGVVRGFNSSDGD
ncbi:imelysin family protein [Marinobacter sp. VGCF2001]|uniref:imelysin family protein n=1 Tax=Marinobacter sp. VGCF2001 TaxID=3417189 RepID=UPI003CED1F4F